METVDEMEQDWGFKEFWAYIGRLERELAEADALIAAHRNAIKPCPQVEQAIKRKAIKRHEDRKLSSATSSNERVD